jgi:hypothetical protein
MGFDAEKRRGYRKGTQRKAFAFLRENLCALCV